MPQRYISPERFVRNILEKSPHLIKPQVEESVEMLIRIMSLALVKGYKIKLEDIGTFQVKKYFTTWDYKERIRKPNIRYRVKFKPAEALKSLVNYKEDNIDDLLDDL